MKVYKVRWTPEVKRALILFLVTIFAAGLVIGLIIGKLVFQVEAIDQLPTEVTEETFESTPVEPTVPTIPPETTEPTVVTTDPPVVETEPPVLYYDCPLSHDLQDYIGERVVQRCLCDNALVPVIGSTFVHDNGACMKNKGYDFAVNRLVCHLERYIRKHGTDGYILIGDLKSFFDNIMHWAVSKLLRKELSDLRLIGLSEDLIKQFDPDAPAESRKGLGLGSQISQLLAPAVASYIDHFVKEVLRIKGYGRYMDDFYLIHEDKEYLKYCKEEIRRKCAELGMTLNERKTQIVKLTHGFTFLKVRFYITDTGKIIRKIHPASVTRERRKLKKFHLKWLEGKMTRRDVWNSLQSWCSHAARFMAHHTVNNMITLYAQLFIKGGNPHDLHQGSQGRYVGCGGSPSLSRVCLQAG